MIIINRFDMEFYNGSIKSTLRLARRIKNTKSLKEAKIIGQEMEENALRKLEETMDDL